jgi:hypothetical protein
VKNNVLGLGQPRLGKKSKEVVSRTKLFCPIVGRSQNEAAIEKIKMTVGLVLSGFLLLIKTTWARS